MTDDRLSRNAFKLRLLTFADRVATLIVWAGMATLYWQAVAGLVDQHMAAISAQPGNPSAWVSFGMTCLLGVFLLIGSKSGAKLLVGIVTVPLRTDLEQRMARRGFRAAR